MYQSGVIFVALILEPEPDGWYNALLRGVHVCMLQRATRSEPVRGDETGAELNLATRPCMMRRVNGLLGVDIFPCPRENPRREKKRKRKEKKKKNSTTQLANGASRD